MEPNKGLLHFHFSPSGRINRSSFWIKGVLLHTILWILIWIVFWVVVGGTLGVSLGYLVEELISLDFDAILYIASELVLFALLWVVLTITHLWISFTITVKRLHDRGKSAWWIAIWFAISFLGAFVFFIGPIVAFFWALIELGFLEGTIGRNRYGDDPNRFHSQAGYVPSQLRSGAVNQPVNRNLPSPSPRSDDMITTSIGERMKRCPYCAEVINYAAIKCRHCQSLLHPPDERPATSRSSIRTSGRATRPCPNCGKQIGLDANVCLYCGNAPN